MSNYANGEVPEAEIDTNVSELMAAQSSDSTQASMMAEAVLQVDENDVVVGPISKADSHYQSGSLHRAFSVLLFNSDGKLLLQQRAHDKITFPSVWANSCCSHPLASAEEMEENDALGVKVAAIRKLDQELGIAPDSIDINDFHFITKMRYSARMNADWIEREIDHILMIQADVELDPNPNEVSAVKWVSAEELDAMLVDEDSDDVIAPWFRCIAARLMNEDWWNAIGDKAACEALQDGLIHDMGDVTHMLPNAEGANLLTSINEVKPFIEQRIVESLTASRHERLAAAMMHLILGGGKRMRATLPWLVGRAVGDTHSGLLDIGAAIETIHNFTLVHDDIMDDDEIRRGRNAVHIEYDMPTAINAGDAMLAIAFERLVMSANIELHDIPSLVNRIAWMVRRVSEGQQLDIEFETRERVTEDEYIEMIEGKTAVMFQICAELGARVAGADDEVIECLAEWGRSVGLCFQLMDDLIDVLSDSATLGKPTGSDVAQGKQTLMVIHALSQPDSEVKSRLLSVLGKCEDATESMVQDGIAALDELGSIDYARERANEYHQHAHACLDRLPDGPAMLALRELTDLQLKRLS
ncbi:MAG: isopentenyl-diphosphate delta-isomerase [Candidatus Poseidoniaceae archaeon]